MRLKLITAVTLTVAALTPQAARASIWTQTACGGGTLQTCVDFALSQIGDTYYFSTTFVSSQYGANEDWAGVITAVGLYDLEGAPLYDLTGVTFESTLSSVGNWTGHDDDPCHTTGDAAGAQLFEGCADANPSPIKNGMRIGDTVVFSFTLGGGGPITAASFTQENGLGARVHIQSYTEEQCSVKLDSRLAEGGNDGFFSGEDCRGTSVPEPMSTLLIGAGLVGVGMISRRRRLLELQQE